jgi:ferritin
MSIEFLKRPIKKNHNPMIDESCTKNLQTRIQQEEESSRLYLSMSMWLNNEGYTGAAKLWKKYSEEEMTHADWAREYLLAMGITPIVSALSAQPTTFTGLPQIIKDSYDHEILITKQIKVMASSALKEGDHMVYELYLRYLKEQVEEHDKTQTWVDKLNAFGEDKLALRLLDEEMGK